MSSLPVLYSFRRCPYAIRARLALAVAGTPFTLREVVLRHKPAALLAASAKATVPVLVLADASVVEESLAIMRWALERCDPEGWLAYDLGKSAGYEQGVLAQQAATPPASKPPAAPVKRR